MKRLPMNPRLAVAALCGLWLAAGATPAAAQQGSSRQDSPTSRQAGRGDQEDRAIAADNFMLIAHALGMALQGSSLDALANQKVGAGNEPAHVRAAEELRRHARSAFEASDRLFRQAGQTMTARGLGAAPVDDEQAHPYQSFFTFANEYASTLRRLGGREGAEAHDPVQVALINHAVCEALDAHKLEAMVSQHESSSEASQALAQHARRMLEESRQAMQAAGAGGDGNVPADREDDGSVQATTRTLAHQGQAIIKALDELRVRGQGRREGTEGRDGR